MLLHRGTIVTISLYATLALLMACGSDSQFRGGSATGIGGKGKDAGTAQGSEDANPNGSETSPVSLNTSVNNSTIPDSDTDNTDVGLDDGIVFGDEKVFRIGNGVAYGNGISCLADVDAFSTSGKRYEFSFDVLKDDTTVQISLNRLCGVDMDTYNLIYLTSGSTVMQKAALKKNQSKAVMEPTVLAKGRYSFWVESTQILTGQFKGEYDDFIVGDIHITADKKLTPGSATPH